MEKIPEFRIVGGASEEKKEAEKMKLQNAFSNNLDSFSPAQQEELRQLEITKSEDQIILINFANQETDRLMEEVGLESYDIPQENYHIVPPEMYGKLDNNKLSITSSAITFYKAQTIFFNNKYASNPVLFGTDALHETLHLKGHLTLEVEETEDGEVRTTPYREGVAGKAAQRLGFNKMFHSHFDGLHEAIVAKQEKKSFSNMLNLDIFREYKEWFGTDDAKEKRKNVSERKNIPEDDILWIDKDSEDWESIYYSSQRNVLEYVCQEIQRDNSDAYDSIDAVFKEFLKAQFTGKLLRIAHLVDDSFGKGSFRLLGNMKTDKESGVLHLEALGKKRLETVKNNR